MRSSTVTIKGILTFILVLIVTAGIIFALSSASKSGLNNVSAAEVGITETVGEETQQQLSAVIKEEAGFSLASFGAFALLLVFPSAFIVFLMRRKKRNPEAVYASGRRYNPKAEVAFKNIASYPAVRNSRTR